MGAEESSLPTTREVEELGSIQVVAYRDRHWASRLDVLRELLSHAVLIVVPGAKYQLGEMFSTAPSIPLAQVDLKIGFHQLEIDLDDHRAYCGPNQLSLTELDLRVLATLAVRAPHVVTFSELHRRAWGDHYLGDGSHIRSAVKRLRRKLYRWCPTLAIESVRGVGFRMGRVADTASQSSGESPPPYSANLS